MKTQKLLLMTLTTLLLSGCVDLSPVNPNQQKTQTVDETTSEVKVNVMEDFQKTNQKRQQLQQLIAKKFESTEKVTMDLEIEMEVAGNNSVINQSSQEIYQKGQLKNYLVTQKLMSGEQQIPDKVYFDGTNYYHQFNEKGWETMNGDTKSSILFISLMKFLFEGTDQWTINENPTQLTVTKQVTDPALLKIVTQLCNFSIMLSKNTQTTMDATYQIDPKSGTIQQIKLNLALSDLGDEFPLTLTAKLNQQAEFEDLKVDIEAKPTTPADEEIDLLAEFKKANPVKAVNYLETYLHDGEHTFLEMTNYQSAEPYRTVMGQLKEQQLTDIQFVKTNQSYRLQDNKVVTDDKKMINYYAQYVNRVSEKYDQLIEVEASEESQYLTLREFFEQDQAAFIEATNGVETQGFVGEQYVYGLDYLIDKQTYQLIGVVIWSTSADSTEVAHTMTINFDNFNGHNPSLILNQVSDTLLNAIK